MTKGALGMTKAALGMTKAGLGMTKAALGMTKAALGMTNWVLLECLNPPRRLSHLIGNPDLRQIEASLFFCSISYFASIIARNSPETAL